MSNNIWEVQSTSDKKTLSTVIKDIDSARKGEQGINLDPDYQREYKFTIKDESLLIESLLLGIPIPTIYLSSDITKLPHIANVIDGQHRLRAVYRFLKNEFALKELEKEPSLNDLYFEDLSPELQNKLNYQCNFTFENIHVQNNPELEMEIFKRYNIGTHPLSKQEIRHAVYRSEFNLWLNTQVDEYFNSEELKEIYNITKKRYSDKSAHESIYIMVYILIKGLNPKYDTSPEYAEGFMKIASETDDQSQLIESCKGVLQKMNDFLLKIRNENNVKYPFSKEIYGVESRSYRLQMPILMLISSFVKFLLDKEVDILEKRSFDKIMRVISNTLKNSYLEDNYKGSNTRPMILEETSEEMRNLFDFDNSEII